MSVPTGITRTYYREVGEVYILFVGLMVVAACLAARTRYLEMLHVKEDPFLDDESLRTELAEIGPKALVQRMLNRVTILRVVIYALAMLGGLLMLFFADMANPGLTPTLLRVMTITTAVVLLTRAVIRYKYAQRIAHVRRQASLRVFAHAAAAELKQPSKEGDSRTA